jgi:hypothetical protein
MYTGPWNPGPPSRHSRTPDLDDFLQGLRKRLKPCFSGGKLGTRAVALDAVVGTRMTRGRCGLLRLHRNALAPSTFRRSPGAPVHRRCREDNDDNDQPWVKKPH